MLRFSLCELWEDTGACMEVSIGNEGSVFYKPESINPTVSKTEQVIGQKKLDKNLLPCHVDHLETVPLFLSFLSSRFHCTAYLCFR